MRWGSLIYVLTGACYCSIVTKNRVYQVFTEEGAPLRTYGQTLHTHADLRFTVFPRQEAAVRRNLTAAKYWMDGATICTIRRSTEMWYWNKPTKASILC